MVALLKNKAAKMLRRKVPEKPKKFE